MENYFTLNSNNFNLLTKIHDEINVFFLVIDKNGAILQCNKYASDCLGYTTVEFNGRNILDLYPPSYKKEVKTVLLEAISGKTVSCDLPMLNTLGFEVPVESSMTLGVWNNKKVVFSVCKDMSGSTLSERIFSTVFEFNAHSVAISEFETGRFLDANQRFLEIFNFKKEEIIGKTSVDLGIFSVLTRNKIISEYNRNNQLIDYPIDIQYNNTTFSFLLSAKTFQYEAKKFWITFFNNVTELKKIQHNLQDSINQFSVAVRGSNDGIWDWNIETNNLYLSVRWKEQLGYEDHELPNNFSTFEGNLHPEDKPRVLEYVDNYLNGKINNYDIEFRMLHKDGSYRWIRARGEALRDSQGRAYRMAGSQTDITEKKLKDIEIAQKTATLENFFNINLDLLCIADLSGRFVKVNKMWEEILGHTVEELENSRFLDFIHPDDLDATLKAISTLKKQETILNFINRYRMRDGNYRHIEWRSHPSGEFIYAAARDITQHLQMEKSLKELVSTKDKLLSIITHDLKNTFNTILGFSELLLNNSLEYTKEEQEKFISIINTSAKNTHNLLQNMLTWSRLQTGQMSIKPVVVNLSKLTDEVFSVLSAASARKEVGLIKEINDDLSVSADLNMIEIVVRNLLNNAIKYSHNGGEVRISAEAGNGHTLITVSDNGTGMDKKTLNSLFKIGETKSKDGTVGESGTGMGLILCKEFIEKHNGLIWAESESGTGSKFSFTIPNHEV